MITSHRKRYVPYSALQMYALIHDTASYPHFVPYCSKGQVIEQTAQHIVASLTFTLLGQSMTLVTRNTCIPEHAIHFDLVSGPCDALSGSWLLHPQMQGCEIECTIQVKRRPGLITSWISAIAEHYPWEEIFILEAHKRYATLM